MNLPARQLLVKIVEGIEEKSPCRGEFEEETEYIQPYEVETDYEDEID